MYIYINNISEIQTALMLNLFETQALAEKVFTRESDTLYD